MIALIIASMRSEFINSSSIFSLENATSGMTAPFHKGAAKYFAEKGITVTAE